MGKAISIEHFGVIDKGQVVTNGSGVDDWVGAQENYYLREENNETILTVVTDTNAKYEEYMREVWPKALDRLKEICEA